VSLVRTIRKQPLLAQIMQTAGGVHARTALEQARAVIASTRGENIDAIGAALTRMGEWRALAAPGEDDWNQLFEASSSVISLCDPDEDVHLVRAARLLCDYINRTRAASRSAAIGGLFISTMKSVASQEADEAARAEVMRRLEDLIQR